MLPKMGILPKWARNRSSGAGLGRGKSLKDYCLEEDPPLKLGSLLALSEKSFRHLLCTKSVTGILWAGGRTCVDNCGG
jgi:hypothetical protein